MPDFTDNTTSLKKYKDLEKEDILRLISLNDFNLEYEKVDQARLKEYLKTRRQAINYVDLHVEALRRKEALRQIKDDAQRLITLNKYISHLIEEKKEPLDTLLSNLEYSEIYLGEGNVEMGRSRKRCAFLRTVGKIFLLLLLVLVILKIKSSLF